MQSKQQKPLSFIDILARNLFLFTVMCVFLGFGVVVSILQIYSLDSYIFQIHSDRLNFIFFIGVAACYVSLLFISINRYWLNFTVQCLVAIALFFILLFIFSPALKVKSYLLDHYIEFSTREWSQVYNLPIGKEDTLGRDVLIQRRSYYFFSFVFTSHAMSPIDSLIKTNED